MKVSKGQRVTSAETNHETEYQVISIADSNHVATVRRVVDGEFVGRPINMYISDLQPTEMNGQRRDVSIEWDGEAFTVTLILTEYLPLSQSSRNQEFAQLGEQSNKYITEWLKNGKVTF